MLNSEQEIPSPKEMTKCRNSVLTPTLLSANVTFFKRLKKTIAVILIVALLRTKLKLLEVDTLVLTCGTCVPKADCKECDTTLCNSGAMAQGASLIAVLLPAIYFLLF